MLSTLEASKFEEHWWSDPITSKRPSHARSTTQLRFSTRLHPNRRFLHGRRTPACLKSGGRGRWSYTCREHEPSQRHPSLQSSECQLMIFWKPFTQNTIGNE